MSFDPNASGALLARTVYFADGATQTLASGDQFIWAVETAGGTEPLDLTEADQPSFVDGGIYSITAVVNATVPHAGKNLWASLVLTGGLELTIEGHTPLDLNAVHACASATYYVPAGQQIYLIVRHDIGVASAFQMQVLIQKITNI